MKSNTEKEYSKLTLFAKGCGLLPYTDRMGNPKPGFYSLPGLHAPVDLTASGLSFRDIYINALKQLSEQADENQCHHFINKD